jgi:hypothetical protein
MVFRKKRIVLLASIAVLFVLLILDIWIKKEDMLEAFGEQFFNEQRSEEYAEAHKDVVVTAEKKLEMNRQEIKEVALSNKAGNISVKRATDNMIQLQYTITASARNIEAAKRKQEAVTIQEQISNERLTLAAMADGKALDDESITLDYVLLVPDAMKLWIENEDGAIAIHGINGDVNASTENGLTEIVDVRGNLSVKANYESLYISDITGSVNLENRSSEVNIEHVEGAIVLDGQSGSTFISHIKGEVTGETERGEIHLREVVGRVEFQSRESALQLDHIRGDIQVHSDSGALTLILAEAEGYALDAAVSNARIQTRLPFPIVYDTDGSHGAHMKGVIGNGTRKVAVVTNAADIIIYSK